MQVVPRISVVIVSYNTRAMTLDCLKCLMLSIDPTDAEVFVVDNASSDGSAAAVAEAWPTVRMIENDRNLGFGTANNIAIRQAQGKFILLLNSDAFVEPGAIDALISAMDSDPAVGVTGPKLLNADGTTQVSCFPFPSPYRAWIENLGVPRLFSPGSKCGDYRRWKHDELREVDWLIGACLLVKRDVIKQIGGFDERFFMYAEETDWLRRIRQANWKVVFAPKARVTHLGGASGNRELPLSEPFFKSLDLYTLKHHGLIGLLCLRAAMCIGCGARALGWTAMALLRSGDLHQQAVMKARKHARLLLRQSSTWNNAH